MYDHLGPLEYKLLDALRRLYDYALRNEEARGWPGMPDWQAVSSDAHAAIRAAEGREQG